MGFMRALGRTIFAYTNDDRPLLDRVATFCGAVRVSGEHAAWQSSHYATRQPDARRRCHRLGWVPHRCHAPTTTRRLLLSSAVSGREQDPTCVVTVGAIQLTGRPVSNSDAP